MDKAGFLADPCVRRWDMVEFLAGRINQIDPNKYRRFWEKEESFVIEEYVRARPWLNILSGEPSKDVELTDPLLKDIEQLSRLPGLREAFEGIVDQAKRVLAQKLKMEKIE